MNAVLDALATVDDPEYPGVSIVDLGLVERVEVSGRSVEVDLVPTFSGCPALEMIATDVAATVGALDERRRRPGALRAHTGVDPRAHLRRGAGTARRALRRRRLRRRASGRLPGVRW